LWLFSDVILFYLSMWMLDPADQLFLGLCLFFFSSRRRHTRFSRDWSSDVVLFRSQAQHRTRAIRQIAHDFDARTERRCLPQPVRSEERRVGKECRSRWTRDD